MDNTPVELKYSESHEWVRIEGSEAVIGITHHAQESLSDVVYVELPSVGATFSAGDKFGVVESVKAASDLYMPLSGMVTAVNEDLAGDPSVVNSDPYGAGWMLRLKPAKLDVELNALLDAAGYDAFIAKEG